MNSVSYFKESDLNSYSGIKELNSDKYLNKLSSGLKLIYSEFDENDMIEDLKFIPKEKFISFNLDDKIYQIPYKLSHIIDSIDDSKEILKLQDNWDEEGANATNLLTYNKSIFFLIKYSKFIFDKYNQILRKPHIDLTRDGSVSILWDTAISSFLIIFKRTENEYAYFYGKEKLPNVPFKYAIKIGSEIDEITALWMQKNLI